MKKENNTITFIIVNYNSSTELNICLTDLSKINYASSFEVIIVNNDKKPVCLSQHNFKNQKVIEINKNIGYGSACNIGLNEVTTKFICFLNPDTLKFCKNLSKITTYLENSNTIVSPKILTTKNQPEPWSVGEKITLQQTLKNNFNLCTKKWLSTDIITTDWVSGAAMFSTTKFVRDLNGFDEDFFLYFEDVDLCQRATDCGGEIKYIPKFTLTHSNGCSSKDSTKKQKKCYYTSQDLFFKKHLGPTQTYFMQLCRFFHKN
ncbi:MAG: glycosyltransferase [Candidatus Moraniibacteriota bacterium]|jgi:GT2 family glycosyltransferase